ncbi:MAG: hypothetical protein HY719_01505, partial [Planctomycetes bacterium]|nr:hypothetical protein [Planctomycetota bacterium]
PDAAAIASLLRISEQRAREMLDRAAVARGGVGACAGTRPAAKAGDRPGAAANLDLDGWPETPLSLADVGDDTPEFFADWLAGLLSPESETRLERRAAADPCYRRLAVNCAAVAWVAARVSWPPVPHQRTGARHVEALVNDSPSAPPAPALLALEIAVSPRDRSLTLVRAHPGLEAVGPTFGRQVRLRLAEGAVAAIDLTLESAGAGARLVLSSPARGKVFEAVLSAAPASRGRPGTPAARAAGARPAAPSRKAVKLGAGLFSAGQPLALPLLKCGEYRVGIDPGGIGVALTLVEATS